MSRIGRGSDQFRLRLPDGLRDQIRDAAEASGRSMNAEIVHRLTGGETKKDLRDWFAGQALAGLVTSNVMDCVTGNQHADGYADDAYTIADAMLAARERGGAS